MSGFNMGASKSVCKMYVIDPVLRQEYEKRVVAHNTRLNDSSHPDSGFDILQPCERILCRENELNNKIPLGLMAAAYDIESNKPLAYYLFPRSSISRSCMRMSNSVGIIDSGYRGELIAAVDLVAGRRAHVENGAGAGAVLARNNTEFADSKDIENGNIEAGVHIHVKDRYFQICMGDLRPFYVELVDKLEDLGITQRGAGGFGSTGH
jgi:dUTP pyrophosphatase